MATPLVLVGTYTKSSDPKQQAGVGIYAFTFDTESGELTPKAITEGMDNPSYLTPNAAGTHVYAVMEVGDFGGEATGGVGAYALNRDTGALTLVNTRPSYGKDPCHIVVDPTGEYVLVANYSSGNVSVLPVRADGGLGEATDVITNRGAGPDDSRQMDPHAHGVTLDRTGKFALVSDLGIDRIGVYKFNPLSGKLAVAGGTDMPGGAGPRQLVFSPDNRYVYSANEMASTLSVFAFDVSNGNLRHLQTLRTVPADFEGDTNCAAVRVSPSGDRVYVSNRGHDSIAVFTVSEDGSVELAGNSPIGGQTPRNFNVSPDGGYLIVANQGSGSLTVLDATDADGIPKLTREADPVPLPVCVQFVPSAG